MMKTIYRSEEGKNRMLALYDSQLSRLSAPWRDIWVWTSFGVTHVVETGNPRGEPLLVFHGGNATTACNLLARGFLLWTIVNLRDAIALVVCALAGLAVQFVR